MSKNGAGNSGPARAANAANSANAAAQMTGGVQPSYYADAEEGGKYSRGNHYFGDAADDYYGNGYSMSRLRLDSATGRYSVVSQDLGVFVSGQRCATGETPNVDGMCSVGLSAPSVLTSSEEASQQLDSMFAPYVQGAVPELSRAAKALVQQRSPGSCGSVYGRLMN